MRLELEIQLWAKGYGDMVVLGPFEARAREAEYAVRLRDPGTGLDVTRRATYELLRDWIDGLPDRVAAPPRRPSRRATRRG